VPEQITAKHKTWKSFIRKYASSIEAKGADKEELISLSNNIPYDDRANTLATVTNISMLLVQDHLIKIESKLALEVGKLSYVEVLQQMALLSGPNEYLFPRNVALMLFAEKPHLFFPYTWVEIVHFYKGASDKEFTEKKIEGPVQRQITDALNWFRNNILQEKVTKIPGQAEALRTWNYPYIALEETIANCLFHRNYQDREPVKIRIEPNGILLYNSGGPDRSIKREDFASGRTIPKRYRNRRLGDFFKELRLTEGHATGLPALKKAIQRNGSPDPVFDFDEERTWFQVLLPIHPDFVQKQPLHIDLSGVIWDIRGIDKLLNEILEKAGISQMEGIAGGIAGGIADNRADNDKSVDLLPVESTSIQPDDIAGGIAGGIAGNQADTLSDVLQIIDNKALEIIDLIRGNQVPTIAGGIADNIAYNDKSVNLLTVDSTAIQLDDIVGGIAGGIVGGIADKFIKVLEFTREANSRKEILNKLKLVNNANNFETYIQPLVAVNWLTMTIPHKPTSPKQQYATILKGRLILEFLKHKTR
jgi:hypothetical protein